MTAQLLQTELSTLLQETKKKDHDQRAAVEKSLSDLKGLPRTSEAQIAADLRSRPFFVHPFITACKSRNPKLAGSGIICLQRLIISNALSGDTLGDVLESLYQCSSLGLEIQLRVLQALPTLLSNYADQLTGQLLISAFQICFLLYANKNSVVSNTAAATLQQLVETTFHKVASQEDDREEGPATVVSLGDRGLEIRGVRLDAFRLLDDICLITEGQTSKYIQGASISQTFGLELIGSILKTYAKTLSSSPELIHVLRIRTIPLIIRLLSEKASFTATVRAAKILQLLLGSLFIPLLDGLGACLKLANSIVDSDTGPIWKRVLCLEIYRDLHNEAILIRQIYAHFDAQDGRRDIIRDHLGGLVRLSTESSMHSKIASKAQEGSARLNDASKSEILQTSGVAGISEVLVPVTDPYTQSTATTQAKHPISCLDTLDKSDPPEIPSWHMAGLVIQCIAAFEEGIARFLLPLTLPMERKAKRRGTKMKGDSDMINNNHQPMEEGPRSIATEQFRRCPINPMTLKNHPAYEEICTAAQIVDQCWPPLLAASSTYLDVPMELHTYHTLIRSFQKFTQIAGLLDLSTPRDAFLTTLSKYAVPPSISTTNTARKSESPGHQTGSATLPGQNSSTQQAGLGTPLRNDYAGRDHVSEGEASYNTCQLLCLRALLNLGTALGPVLRDSWAIIFETLVQGSLVLRATPMAKIRTDIEREEKHNPQVDDVRDEQRSIINEITAIETAAMRLLESTSELTDSAFLAAIGSLCQMLHVSALGRQEILSLPNRTDSSSKMELSIPITHKKHQKLRSISNIYSEQAVADHESSCILSRIAQLVRFNISRLKESDVEQNGWSLLLSNLMSIISAIEAQDRIRLLAAKTLNDIFDMVAARSARSEGISDETSVVLRVLNALAQEITLFCSSGTASSKSTQQCTLEMHLNALNTLRAILECNGDTLTKGWKEVFTIIGSAFTSHPTAQEVAQTALDSNLVTRSPALTRSSFQSLQLLAADFLVSIPQESLPRLLHILLLFSTQTDDFNISLTSVSLFKTLSDHMLDDEMSASDAYVPNTQSLEIPPIDVGRIDSIWLNLLHKLAIVSVDQRKEIRHSAMHTVLRIVEPYMERLSTSGLATLFTAVLIEMLSFNQQHCEITQDREKQTDKTSTSSEDWNDSAVILLNGISSLITQYIEMNRLSTKLSALLLDLFQWYGKYLERKSLKVVTAVFGSCSKLLSVFENRDDIINCPLAELWHIWQSGISVLTSMNDPNKNDALLAHLYCLGQLLRLSGRDFDEGQIHCILDHARSAIIISSPINYASDVTTMTSVQRASLEVVKMVSTECSKAGFEVLSTANYFLSIAYTQKEEIKERNHSYIAFSKSAMGLPEQIIRERLSRKMLVDSAWYTAAITSLLEPLRLEYTLPLKEREPSSYRVATTAVVSILEFATATTERRLQQDSMFWDASSNVLDAIMAPNVDSRKDIEKMRHDEGEDIHAFEKVKALLVPALCSQFSSKDARDRFCQSLFRHSIIHEPNPDDLARPNEPLLSGLDREHFGRVRRLLPTSRSKMSYLALSVLFDLVRYQENRPERQCLAESAGPYFILRIGVMLRMYIMDQPLRGKMPQPRHQKDEMLYILDQLCHLDSSSVAILGSRKVQSEHKSHLYRLYPWILQAIKVASRDDVLRAALNVVLDIISSDMKWVD